MKLEDFKRAGDIQQQIHELNECLSNLNPNLPPSPTYIKCALCTYKDVTNDDDLLCRVRDEVYDVIQSKVTELEKEFTDL